jgi:hypothetical protein
VDAVFQDGLALRWVALCICVRALEEIFAFG